MYHFNLKMAIIAPVDSILLKIFFESKVVKWDKHCVVAQYVIDRKLLFYSWVHRKKKSGQIVLL